MNLIKSCLFLLIAFSIPFAGHSQNKQVKITAENELSVGRLNQTLEINSSMLNALGKFYPGNIHVKNDAGKELVVQAIRDHTGWKILFQADFGPHQTQTFYAYSAGGHFYPTEAYKTYGRFVRERLDDFAWENDRIAMRAYGPALRTAQPGALSSSAIDIWCKKTDKLIINEWYMKDHYHYDTGEGADIYQSGTTRGVGGDGVWAKDKLWTADNFTHSTVFSPGPIRISFKLDHDAFSVDQKKVKETRYISLDAGQNLNHFTIRYDEALPSDFLVAAGIQKTKFSTEDVRRGLNPDNMYQPKERKPTKILQKKVSKEGGWIATEQDLSEGKLFGAVIVNPTDWVRDTQDEGNELILAKHSGEEFSYWAGFGWSESGQFKNFDEWVAYIDQFAKEINSPIKVSVGE